MKDKGSLINERKNHTNQIMWRLSLIPSHWQTSAQPISEQWLHWENWHFNSWAWCYVVESKSLVNLSQISWLCPWQPLDNVIPPISVPLQLWFWEPSLWCATERWAVPLLQVLSSPMMVGIRGPQSLANWNPAPETPGFIGPGTEGSEVAYDIQESAVMTPSRYWKNWFPFLCAALCQFL